MKRFFICFLMMIGIYATSEYMVYYKGAYIQRSQQTLDVPVRTVGNQISIRDEAGRYVPFEVKGVEMTSSLPGYELTDFKVDKETYLRWFGQIQEMGANTIRTHYIMDDTFYNALYTYNMQADTPLYLLQGIGVSAYAGNNHLDGYQEAFYSELLDQVKTAVDVIHGNKNILLNKQKGRGIYRKDLSSWVLGYIVGNTWHADTVAYTNHRGYDGTYEGRYFKTSAEATAFEALLAGVLDQLITYETSKYGQQRLVSFENTPLTDPFAYDPHYAKQLGKHTQLDAEHLIPTDALASGYFATYQFYDFYPQFYRYFSDAQKAQLPKLGQLAEHDLAFEGYGYLLVAHHTVPVIAQYGYSSARGIMSGEPLSEQAQGEALVRGYEALMAAGSAGVLISEWQDTWGHLTWNTSYGVTRKDGKYWHDLQSQNQGYGLLSFESGESGTNSYVDGVATEWQEEDRVITEGPWQLALRADYNGLRLLVEGTSEVLEGPLYMPIDITPKSGRKSDGADFLLVLDAAKGSRLLVHERYESIRSTYAEETTGINAYEQVPEAASGKFVPIQMMLGIRQLIRPSATEAFVRAQSKYQVYETGRLRHGNGNPASPDFDSLTDVSYGEGVIEVRLPWQLLNFMAPHQVQVHDDYYAHYGVSPLGIDAIHIGIGTEAEGNSKVPLSEVRLSGWDERLVYHERLKASYYLMQAIWNPGGVNDAQH